MIHKTIAKTCLISATIIVLNGCATDQTNKARDIYLGYSQTAANSAIAEAAQAILNGNPENANALLNIVLSESPKDPLANLLNGMAYQARATGEGPNWDMAKIGYQLARKFDPYLWQASYLLGIMKLKERSLAAAAVAFSEASLANPTSSVPLYALAAASYAQGDLSTAYRAAQKASHLDKNQSTPRDRHILTLCDAAVGEFTAAAAQIAAMQAAGVPAIEIQWLKEKLRTWQEFHANITNQPLINTAMQPDVTVSNIDPTTPSSAVTALPRMVNIEAIILRTAVTDSHSRGVNLLDGLSAQFEGVLINSSRNRVDNRLTNQLTADDKTLINSVQLSIPAVKYSLNIANSTDSSSRIVGSPSVLALDGKESKFFIGSEVTVYMNSDISSAAAAKEFGLSIQVTPTFLSDDTVQLQVDSGLSSLNSSKPAGINMDALTLEKVTNTTSAVMRFGETLIVSTGTIYQENSQQSGVPVLNKIPLVDNLFSNRSTRMNNGTLLILLTLKPREERASPTKSASTVFTHHPAIMQMQQYFEPMTQQVQDRLNALQNRDVLRIIRPTDVAPANPVYSEGLDDIISWQWRQHFMTELTTI